MPYTSHGHWFGAGEPTLPMPRLRARCGGPGLCSDCDCEAAASHRPGQRFMTREELAAQISAAKDVTTTAVHDVLDALDAMGVPVDTLVAITVREG